MEERDPQGLLLPGGVEGRPLVGLEEDGEGCPLGEIALNTDLKGSFLFLTPSFFFLTANGETVRETFHREEMAIAV